ncbi:hypothetical protein BV22DRAFT_1132700 [Leucogyrophana mollusca]|uniref:Uncharacterized protein n=1 Tax=Leucogyrophana mollusca TaxID=85980 RepID=A0ACB8B5Y5_9AGAM|nr:hypothetical protein BV22DRAFT_1132700 [Leucogyrophana mollusca]
MIYNRPRRRERTAGGVVPPLAVAPSPSRAKSSGASRSNEIRKLRDVGGAIFDIPTDFFSDPDFDRLSIAAIRKRLFVDMDIHQYILFPPILFTGLRWDPQLKNVFGNWLPLARIEKVVLFGKQSLSRGNSAAGPPPNGKIWRITASTPGSLAWSAVIAIFLLSPDKGFSKTNAGTQSKMDYRNMFYNYKKLFITSWHTRRLRDIVKNINEYVFGRPTAARENVTSGEDFSAAMDNAIAALNMDSDSDDLYGPEAVIPSASHAAAPNVEINPEAEADVEDNAAGENLELEGENLELEVAALTSYDYVTQLSYFENVSSSPILLDCNPIRSAVLLVPQKAGDDSSGRYFSASCVLPNLKGWYSPRNNNVDFDCAQDQYAATRVDLSYYIADIANAAWARFTEHGSLADLDLAVTHNEETLLLRPIGHPHRYASLRNLAAALWTRQQAAGDGQGKGNAEDLDLTIVHLTSALAASPPDRASLLDDLSAALQTRYVRQNNSVDLDAAIDRLAESASLKHNPRRAQSHQSLASALRARFERTGDVADLEKVVTHNKTALDLSPPDSESRWCSLREYAAALHALFEQQRDSPDLRLLHLAISHDKEALSMCPHNDPGRAKLLSNLGAHLYSLFVASDRKQASDLDRAADALVEALRVCHEEAGSDYAEVLNNIGGVLQTRFTESGNERDIHQAIGYLNIAVALPAHPQRLSSFINLAKAHWAHHQRWSAGKELDLAIRWLNEALSLCSPGQPTYLEVVHDVAVYYEERYSRDANITDLDSAIRHGKEALRVCPLGYPRRGVLLNNLGLDMNLRFIQRGSIDDMHLSIRHLMAALQLRPKGHTGRSATLNNLGLSTRLRFHHFRDISDLDRAIVYHQEALQSARPGEVDYKLLNNLAAALLDRFNERYNLADLHMAIEQLSEAHVLCPPGHRHHTASHSNLGGALLTRFRRLRQPKNLTTAIEHAREAVCSCDTNDTDSAQFMSNLAVMLLERFSLRGEALDVELAFDQLNNAQQILPDGHPQLYTLYLTFASALNHRYALYHQKSDFEEGILYTEKAVNLPSASPSKRLESSLDWVSKSRGHSSQVAAYRASLDLLDRHVVVAPSLLSRHHILRTIAPSSLASDAAACAIGRGQLDAAVELLEQGRALLWTQLARFRTPLDTLRALGDRGRRLAIKLEHLSRLLERCGTHTGEGGSNLSDVIEDGQRYQEISHEWDVTVDEIRSIAGYESFLRPLLFVNLQAAANEGPIIIVNISRARCDAIIITSSEQPVLVRLHVTQSMISDMSSRFASALKTTAAQGEEKKREKQLVPILRDLWDFIVGPITQTLQQIVPKSSRVWWCPTSLLTTLPIHAAGPYRRGELNFSSLYISSYTPTLSALIRSRREQVDAAPTFLAVGQANPHNGSEEIELKSVDGELRIVEDAASSLMNFSRISGAGASRDAVLQGLKTHSWLHLMCHGRQDLSSPYMSSFALHDGPLRLQDIIQEHLSHPEFAFLSACHTATVDSATPDEVIHLAAGMQFSGYRSVIGSMWAVDDGTVERMTQEFYRNMFDGGILDATRAAMALNRASRTLASRGVPLDQRIVFIHIGA